ncbi:MAG: type VI secretion system protein ImpD [Pseudohongiellaceae bacterium]|jgi:type VI secretion system protein ImpD
MSYCNDDFGAAGLNSAVESWLLSSVGKNKRTKSQLLYMIDAAIVRIDKKMNQQMDEIIHHERFKALEASWRGLEYLVDTEADYDQELTVKIKMMSVSWREMSKDVSRAIEFDQSQLFQRIYSDEFDTPGGEPFGVLLGDYKLSHRIRPGSIISDVDVIREISLVATAALCPFISSVDSSLFGLDDFDGFDCPVDLHKVFDQTEYTKWQSLRKTESTRFVGLALPDVLMREPYRADGTYSEAFIYKETSTHTERDYLWGNACYAFGGILIRAFANTGWFADIRGGVHEFGEGGVVRQLNYAGFDTDPRNITSRHATRIQVDDYLERDLSDLGFIPLCSYHTVKNSAFYSNSSLHSPPDYNSHIANSNARLSAMIQYMLCVSRFGHYIKVIGRDKIGNLASAKDCERVFQDWLNQYTTASDDSSPVLKARYPLAESKVEIHDQPGRPGYFSCVIHLKPHFQLDQLVSSIKLVTELAVGTIKN